eukprot:s3061_g13.t1
MMHQTMGAAWVVATLPSKPIKVFGIHVEEDPWAGQPLPPGAAIPDKPLVNEDQLQLALIGVREIMLPLEQNHSGNIDFPSIFRLKFLSHHWKEPQLASGYHWNEPLLDFAIIGMNHCWILAPSSERADLRFYCGECWRSYGRMSCGAAGGAAREPTSFPLPWMQPTSELAVRALANMGGEFLTSAQASQKLWPSSLQACWLLVWYGLLVVSLRCAAGHQWRSFKGNLFLHCTERIPNPDFHSDDEDDGISRKKRNQCIVLTKDGARFNGYSRQAVRIAVVRLFFGDPLCPAEALSET